METVLGALYRTGQHVRAVGSANFDDARLDLLSVKGLNNPGFEGGSLDGWTVCGPGWWSRTEKGM